MKDSFPSPKLTADLLASLHHRLNSYALAASAAGVGMLALSNAAEAEIIYTRANVQIPVNGGLIELDLNHDGINDFEFSNVYKSYTRRGSRLHNSSLKVGPAQTLNRVLRHDSRRLGRRHSRFGELPCRRALQLAWTNRFNLAITSSRWSRAGTTGAAKARTAPGSTNRQPTSGWSS